MPYDPETRYDARVSRTVRVGPLTYRPRDTLNATGVLLNAIVATHGDAAIASAEPRQEG